MNRRPRAARVAGALITAVGAAATTPGAHCDEGADRCVSSETHEVLFAPLMADPKVDVAHNHTAEGGHDGPTHGFRFDLTSVLSREESGCPLSRPSVLWDIESGPVLTGTRLIAEAWDAAGLYQVGSIGGDAWQEWNGRTTP